VMIDLEGEGCLSEAVDLGTARRMCIWLALTV
jgi:hypothetical protein